MYFKPRAESSHLLYLILPSWLLALDRGCRAMKSSPIATRLEYIYARRIHREDRRKNTHRHTQRLDIRLSHTGKHTIHTEPTFRTTRTYRQRQNGTKVRAKATNATQDWKRQFLFSDEESFVGGEVET